MLKKLYTSLLKQERDPRYVFVLLGSLIVFIATTAQVFDAGLFDSVEQPIFAFINTLPQAFSGLMYTITQFGGLGSLPVWMAAAWYLIHKRAAITVAATGFIAWMLAKVVKVAVHRGRPGDVIDDVRLFAGESLGGFGFPSGHAAFSAACAGILYYHLPRRYRKYMLLIVLGVGISRMYLGAHFPLDIVGGWALGVLVASVIALLFGMPAKSLNTPRLKSFLSSKGYPIRSLSVAPVDARGSRPMFMTAADGQEYFAKFFGKQEHAADWLFKMMRYFRYKNLHGEEPYFNGRRNIEMESFAMLWAAEHKVRVPKVVELLRYGDAWVLMQDRLTAKPLADHGTLLTRSLEDAWRQVNTLHQAHIAHRDLRAANVMIDTKGKAWLIDFGFAEVSPRPQRIYMDIAELLTSMSLVAGVDRTLAAACKSLDRNMLVSSLPYLQTAALSGATAKELKQHKDLLQDIRTAIVERFEVEEEIQDAELLRINKRKVFNVALIALFIYVIIPQFSEFKNAFVNINIQNVEWLLPLALASIGTYVLTGLVYVALADVPLKLRESTLVQLASSFVSKFLPGGLASAGMNARYLAKAGLDKAAVSSLLVSQGVISFIMFALPMTLFLLLNGQSVNNLVQFDIKASYVAAFAGLLLAGMVIMLSIESLRAKTAHACMMFLDNLRVLASPSRELSIAAAASLGVTILYIVCLYAAFKAFGLPLGITAAVVVYVSAVIAKSAIPTPGGLGPLEVAMVATLIGFGIAKPDAFTVVILYRLATFWLPIPLSLLAYRYITSRKII